MPQLYGIEGIGIGWTDNLIMLIHGQKLPEPKIVPGSGMRHPKSIIVLPFDNYATDAHKHCTHQFYDMGEIDIGWTDYLIMEIHEPVMPEPYLVPGRRMRH